ncbi:GntR family transcriptional regulator [Mycetocola reblochoni]|uniref:Transcriptional regulator, GntR family n=2 Tax=Mycetocola reblochoni TaxID=331618 RepID=A0A1R4ITM7_9MICO|nr:GntR family transcriptional regulator [Mycetocola reblochoni]RLP71076.1 GntR family transcriptional regulator [Mycetocola reblochoni]SJN22915.1 Transcriptional regulator, GntR family [Mycetocola reblochoni REB411]
MDSSPAPELFHAPDHDSSTPVFTQLREQLLEAIAAGRARAGDRLPTVRALAERLGVAPNTVAKTFRLLEQEGVVETRRRLGTFVAATSDDPVAAAAERAAGEFVRYCAGLGLTPAETVELVSRAAERPR